MFKSLKSYLCICRDFSFLDKILKKNYTKLNQYVLSKNKYIKYKTISLGKQVTFYSSAMKKGPNTISDAYKN